MRHKLFLTILIPLISLSYTTQGQELINSPFSRFNIGSISPAGSYRSLGMGGIGIAMRDNSSVNFANPASYSSFDTISFNFDFGIDYGMSYLSDSVSKSSSDDVNFNHLLMGFPLAKGWGFALGVVPVSNGYYRISDYQLASNLNSSNYYENHTGSGGLTNFFLGSGVNINKHFSVGANMTVMFGKLERSDTVQFNDYNVFHDAKSERLQLGGVNLVYGMQYTTTFKNSYYFNAGVSLSSDKKYKSNYENLSSRFTLYGTVDTISYTSDNSTKALIPGTLNLGISFGKKNKFSTELDFTMTKWSKASIPGASGYMADTKSFLFGAEYIPDKYSNYSFLKRMEYRIGGHIGDDYLVVKGEQLKEFGASFGVGIPLRKSFSKTNLYFDFTRKTGSSGSILPTENVYTMGISLNIYDTWFLKRKYD
jgi:hypothetical protein